MRALRQHSAMDNEEIVKGLRTDLATNSRSFSSAARNPLLVVRGAGSGMLGQNLSGINFDV